MTVSFEMLGLATMQPFVSDPLRRSDDTFSRPEVLPPLQQDEPGRPYGWGPRPPEQAPPPVVRRRPVSPVTYTLVGINVAVFVLMLVSGVSATEPTSQQLLQWGAMDGAHVLFQGQWWRLLTSIFLHIGIIHLATNMWCLWNLGLLAEPLLGPAGLAATYVFTGIAGNVLALAVHPAEGGAGASGAIFGIAGVLIALLGVATLPIPPAELKRLRRSVIYFAVLNFVLGYSADLMHSRIVIDNTAHLGGFLSGLAVGFPLAPRMMSGRIRYMRRQAIVFAGSTVLLAAIAYGVDVYLSGR